MKKITFNVISFIVSLIAIGCVSTPRNTSLEVLNAMEILGRNGSHFQGRLLRIESQGNENTDPRTVRENALIRATWETHQLGFEYFMLIFEEGDQSSSSFTLPGYSTTQYDLYGNARTTHNPGQTYTTTQHSYVIFILACNEDELMDDVPTFLVNTRLEQAINNFNN